MDEDDIKAECIFNEQVHVKEEEDNIKEEPEWEDTVGLHGISAAAARAGLYAKHEVKDEVVLGPEGVQPADIAFTLYVLCSKMMYPAEAGEFIAKHAQHVKIHEEGLDKLCKEMIDGPEVPDTGADMIHPSKEHPRAVDWVFLCDALNFCFWSYTGAEKWTVDGHSGYYALEAALHRAIKEGCDITNPEFYSKITADQLQHIMRGDNPVPIPLFRERLSVLHEVGPILLQKYNGTFETCVKEANKSAEKLLKIIVDNFPCFRDEAVYKNQKVAIYKRAQILVADLWNFFGKEGWGEFEDIEKMTMFADYRVPQVLVFFGVMSYSDELMEKLMKDTLLPAGSAEEVEIRGCSIHAVELLKKKLLAANPGSAEINSSYIDYYLWCYRRKHAEELEKVPFHKTLGIYY